MKRLLPIFLCTLAMSNSCSNIAPFVTNATAHAKKMTPALATLLQHLQTSPDDAQALFNCACELIRTQNYAMAVDAYKFLEKKYGASPGAVYNMAYALRCQGKYHESIDAYKRAISLDTSNAEHAYFGIANAYLALEDFTNGLPAYEKGRANCQKVSHRLPHDADITNKTILIIHEWGLGDLFHFIRYAQVLKNKGAHVFVATDPHLIPLLSLCPYLDGIVDMNKPLTVSIDYKIPVMSLMYDCNTKSSADIPRHIPYLYADPTLVAFWKEKLAHDTNFKIGIHWKGTAEKNTTPQLYLRLAQIPGVSLYALQKDEVEKLTEIPDCPYKTFGTDIDTVHGSFADTAAIIKNLDLVITADTSVAHLAGALGATTWVVLPHIADWRWFLNRTDSPWYPTVTLFRQPEREDWNNVINQLFIKLQELLAQAKNV